MKLEAAQQLKEELLIGIEKRLVVRGDGSRPSIAVGIVPPKKGREFLIAVRPRFRRDLADLREYLDDQTFGEMDVRYTGAIRAAGCSALFMGASISRAAGRRRRTGSLGFFARRNRDGALGLVSNNHILAAEDAGVDGDSIVHPGWVDRRRSSLSVIALLDGNYPRLYCESRPAIDCAFASLVDDRVLPPLSAMGAPTPALSDLLVRKSGRSTDETHGRISAFSLDRCRVGYATGEVEFHGQIEIESLTNSSFAMAGDSGSLIQTEEGAPLGLLHSISAAGGRTNNCGLTFAHPIRAVLDALDVSFAS